MHDGAAIPSAEGDRRAVGLSGAGGGAARGGAVASSGGGVGAGAAGARHAASGAPPLRLTTARLHLSPVAEEDLDELLALHSDPRAFAEDSTAPLTGRDQMAWVLRQWRSSWAVHGVGHLSVRARRDAADGTLPRGLLGVAGLAPLEAEGRTVLSAYWRLSPAATGQGVATEAMRAVLAHPWPGGRGLDPGHGSGDVHGPEIVAVTAAGNRSSLALAARLGFVPAPSARPVPGGRDGDVLLVLPGS